MLGLTFSGLVEWKFSRKAHTVQSLEDRVAAGKALRDTTPLESHAGWKPPKNRMDHMKIYPRLDSGPLYSMI